MVQPPVKKRRSLNDTVTQLATKLLEEEKRRKMPATISSPSASQEGGGHGPAHGAPVDVADSAHVRTATSVPSDVGSREAAQQQNSTQTQQPLRFHIEHLRRYKDKMDFSSDFAHNVKLCEKENAQSTSAHAGSNDAVARQIPPVPHRRVLSASNVTAIKRTLAPATAPAVVPTMRALRVFNRVEFLRTLLDRDNLATLRSSSTAAGCSSTTRSDYDLGALVSSPIWVNEISTAAMTPTATLRSTVPNNTMPPTIPPAAAAASPPTLASVLAAAALPPSPNALGLQGMKESFEALADEQKKEFLAYLQSTRAWGMDSADALVRDRDFYAGRQWKEPCPRCKVLVNPAGRRKHYQELHYDFYFKSLRKSMGDVEKWISVHLGVDNHRDEGSDRSCLHCAGHNRFFKMRLQLLVHIEKHHPGIYTNLQTEYRLLTASVKLQAEDKNLHFKLIGMPPNLLQLNIPQ